VYGRQRLPRRAERRQRHLRDRRGGVTLNRSRGSDHPVVLAGLAALIGSDPHLSVFAVARTAAGARELSDDAQPSVAILDLQLPDGDGISLGVELKRRWPALRVLILTMHADDAAVIQSLASGLDGYLLKDADPEDVLAAVHSAAGGSLVVGRSVSAAVVAAAAAAPRTDALAALDARDLEIRELMVDGLPISQVAARLYLAPKTIRNRISEMLGKLGVTSRAEAISLGRAAGLGNRPRPPIGSPPS
jgi:DNA-binding NarL/FixJ family response regulator